MDDLTLDQSHDLSAIFKEDQTDQDDVKVDEKGEIIQKPEQPLVNELREKLKKYAIADARLDVLERNAKVREEIPLEERKDIDFGQVFQEEVEKQAIQASLKDSLQEVPELAMELVCTVFRTAEDLDSLTEIPNAGGEEEETEPSNESSEAPAPVAPDQPGGRLAASVQMMNFLVETAPQLQKLEEIHNERLFLRDFAALYDWQRGQDKEILDESAHRLREMQKRIAKKSKNAILKQHIKTCESLVMKIVKLENEAKELEEKANAAGLLEMNVKFDCMGKIRGIEEQIEKMKDNNKSIAREVGLMIIAKEELKVRRRIQQINEQIYDKDSEQEFLLDAIGGGSSMIHQNATSKVARTWVEVEVRELLKEKKRLMGMDAEHMVKTHTHEQQRYNKALPKEGPQGPSAHSLQFVRGAAEADDEEEEQVVAAVPARKVRSGIRVGRRVVQLRRRNIDLKRLITPSADEFSRAEWETEEGEDSDGDALWPKAQLGTSASSCPATQMKLLCDQATSAAPTRTASVWFHGPLDSAALMRAINSLAGHHHALKYRIAKTEVLTGIATPPGHLFQRLPAESEAEVMRIVERIDVAFTLAACQPAVAKLKASEESTEGGESRGIGFWKKTLERIRSECGLKAEECQTVSGIKAGLLRIIAKGKESGAPAQDDGDVFAGFAASLGLGPENALQAAQRNLAELSNIKSDLLALLAEAFVVLGGTERPDDAVFVADLAKFALGSDDLPWDQTVPLRVLCLSLEQNGAGSGKHLLAVQPHPLVIGAGALPSLMSELSWLYRSEVGEKLPQQKPPCLLSHGAHDALVNAEKQVADPTWAASILKKLPAAPFSKGAPGASPRDALSIGPLDPALAAKLNAVCQQAAVPLSSLVLACYAAVVSEDVTKSKNVCVGLLHPVLGEPLMQPCVLPVVTELPSSWGLDGVALSGLPAVADAVAKAVANSSSWLDIHMKNPDALVSQIVFAWGAEGGAWQRDIQGLQLSMTAGAKSAKGSVLGSCCPFAALSLEMYCTEDLNIEGRLEYASAHVPQSQALMIMNSLKQTLEKVARGSPSPPDNKHLAVPNALLLPALPRLKLSPVPEVSAKEPSVCVWASGHVDPTALARAFSALCARRSTLTAGDGSAKTSELFQRIRVSDESQAVRAAGNADVAFSLAELREALGFSGPPPQPEKLQEALKDLKATSALWSSNFEPLEQRINWASGPERASLERVKELASSMGPFLGWAVGEGIIAAQSAERASEASLYAEFVRMAMQKRGDTPPPREQRCGLRLLCVDLHGKSLFLLQGDSEKLDQISLALAWRELLWLYEVHMTLGEHAGAAPEEFTQLTKGVGELQKDISEHAKSVAARVLSAYDDLKADMKKYRTNRKGGLQLVDWARQQKAEVDSDISKISNDNPFSFIFGTRDESYGDVTRDFAETVATTAQLLEENEGLVNDFEQLHVAYQEVESHANEVEQWLEETKTMLKTIEDQAGRDVCSEILRELHLPLDKGTAIANELLITPLNPYASPITSLSEDRRKALVLESEDEHVRLVAAWGWKLALAESMRLAQLHQLKDRLEELTDLLAEHRAQYPDDEEEEDEWVAGGEEVERDMEFKEMDKIHGEDADGIRRTATRRNVRMRRFHKAGALPAGLKSLGSVVKNGRRLTAKAKETAGTATDADGIRAELAEDGWELVGEEEVEEVYREQHDIAEPIEQVLRLADAGRDLVTEVGAHCGNLTGIVVKHVGGVATAAVNPIHQILVKARVAIQTHTTPIMAQAASVAFPFIAIAAVGTNRLMVTYQRHSCSIVAKAYQGVATNVSNLNAAVCTLTAPITTTASFYATQYAAHVNAMICPMTAQIGNVTGLAMTRMNAWIAPMKYEMVAIMTPIGLQVNQFTAPWSAQVGAALGPMWRHWDAMWATPGAAMGAFMMPFASTWRCAMNNITSPDAPMSNLMSQMGLIMSPWHAAVGQLCMPIHQAMGAAMAPITTTFDANFKPVECAVATAVGPIVANMAATMGPFGDRMNATMFPVYAQINTIMSPAVAEVNKVVMPYVAEASAEATIATAQIHSHTTAVLGYTHSTITDIAGIANEVVGHTDLMSGACGVAGVAVNGINGSFGGAIPKLQVAVANAPAEIVAQGTGEILKYWEKVDGEVAEWSNWSGAQAHSAIVHVKNVANGPVIGSKTTQVTERTRHATRQTYKRGSGEMMEVDITTDTAVDELRYGERNKEKRKALPGAKRAKDKLTAIKNQ
jgi:hypothetical protein